MYLRELIELLIDELELNGNHKVYIKYDTEYENDIDGVDTIKYGTSPTAEVKYYITNNK